MLLEAPPSGSCMWTSASQSPLFTFGIPLTSHSTASQYPTSFSSCFQGLSDYYGPTQIIHDHIPMLRSGDKQLQFPLQSSITVLPQLAFD